jgi:16S rRNA G966 N2-methylase RsmD
MKEKYTITHLGKTFETINFDPNIPDETCINIRRQFYIKPNIEDVKSQINKIHNGGQKHNLIIDFFIKEVLITAKLHTAKWSIDEFMESNDLIRFALTKINNFPKVFPPKTNIIKNVNTVFRIAPSGTAPKVSNFPYKTMLSLLDKYNINNNYYDYSCGWGIRLLSSLSKNVNYYGTEPNTKLVEQLNKLKDCYIETTNSKSNVKIYNHGSETYIPELKNKMGLIFSSPPYYNFEDYNLSEIDTYENWLNNYWTDTVINIKKYMTKDGHFLLNIKDIKGYNLVSDMTNIITNNGFFYIETLELKNINRIFLKQNDRNTNESIYVFGKNQ